jgi:hypothetical protein
MSDPAPSRRWFRFGLRTLFVAVTALSVYLGVLAFGLSQQSLSSPLWGPILFARDGAQENQTFGRIALLLFAGPVLVISINARTLTAFLVASIAIPLWLFLGLLGWGINV